MAEPTGTPSVWIGQEVHLEYVAVDQIRTDNCTLEGVNDRGVYVSEGADSYFLPLEQHPENRIGAQATEGVQKVKGPPLVISYAPPAQEEPVQEPPGAPTAATEQPGRSSRSRSSAAHRAALVAHLRYVGMPRATRKLGMESSCRTTPGGLSPWSWCCSPRPYQAGIRRRSPPRAWRPFSVWRWVQWWG